MLAFGISHGSQKLLTKSNRRLLLVFSPPAPSLYSDYSCFLFPTHIFPYGDFGKFLSDFIGKCRKLLLVEGCLLLSLILLLTSGKDLVWKGDSRSELSVCKGHGMSQGSLWGQEKCSSPFI